MVRCSPEYKKDYETAERLRKAAGLHRLRNCIIPPDNPKEEGMDKWFDYALSPDGQWERKRLAEYGLGGTLLCDPEGDMASPHKERIRDGAFRFMFDMEDPLKVTISIDFKRVVSIEALKQTIAQQVDSWWEMAKTKADPKAFKVTDFEKIIEVGDLREKEKLTYREIAQRVVPKNYENEPDAAIKSMQGFYKRYNLLINKGGYKDISFP